MQKNPANSDVPETKIRKTKRNKNPTSCLDKTRSFFHCAFCGSENTIVSGVQSCEVCGYDEYYISNSGWFWKEINCKHFYPFRQDILIESCVDCGAYEGPICPNCKRRLWFDGKNKKRCRRCGFHSG